MTSRAALLVCLCLGCTAAKSNQSPDAAATPDALQCPDNDAPAGSHLACHIVLFLDQAGLTASQRVEDAATLRESGAEASLLARGWIRQPDDAGKRVYALGHPAIHEDGQRALFGSDGSVELSTLVSANGGFVEVIDLAPDGSVLQNDVEHVPV